MCYHRYIKTRIQRTRRNRWYDSESMPSMRPDLLIRKCAHDPGQHPRHDTGMDIWFYLNQSVLSPLSKSPLSLKKESALSPKEKVGTFLFLSGYKLWEWKPEAVWGCFPLHGLPLNNKVAHFRLHPKCWLRNLSCWVFAKSWLSFPSLILAISNSRLIMKKLFFSFTFWATREAPEHHGWC